MDKTQLEKMEKAYKEGASIWNKLDHVQFYQTWQVCLEANGIVEERLNHSEPDPDHPGTFRAAIREDPRIPEGYFKLGEDIEMRCGRDYDWKPGKIVAKGSGFWTEGTENVRRIPAWKPKDGEAVLYAFEKDGPTCLGVYTNGKVYVGTGSFTVARTCAHLKPFDGDDSNIGKPWSEIV